VTDSQNDNRFILVNLVKRDVRKARNRKLARTGDAIRAPLAREIAK
jgi:hypothetical protein